MKKKPYTKPESIIVPYYEPLMDDSASTGTYDDPMAKEHDVFFDEDNEEDDELWSDFVPFEEEE